MLLKAKPKPNTAWILQSSIELVTPYSLALVLAYLQYYTPEQLKNARFLAVKHLRNLADWINQPASNLRSLQQHRVLAMHFAVLRAAQFIPAISNQLAPQPCVTRWLHMPYQEAIYSLLNALNDFNYWQASCQELNLENIMELDSHVYLRQSFERQLAQLEVKTLENLQWTAATETCWHLHIPQTLPLWLQFDLRQLGNWTPNEGLICTPLTIAIANQRGYTPETITWLLETGTQEKLSPQHKQQLQQWSRRADAYELRTVQLLSTAQPEQMAGILRQKRLRKHVIEHLSPRHAVVSREIVPQLEKWLHKQQMPLKHSPMYKGTDSLQLSNEEQTTVSCSEQTAVQWLGVRMLVGLNELTHQPVPSPHSLLEQLDSQLDEMNKVELEAIASNMITGLREAIAGRDAFLPAQQLVSQETIDLIEKAIWDDAALTIQYQPLGSSQPSWREIQPLRLEARGTLFYLYAYCLRAETNLTFRLDRIHNIKI